MYRITRKIDGKYACYLMYQDGHEDWEECSMEDAIESMISGAYSWNHSVINANDIEFYQEKPIKTTEVIPMEKPKAIRTDSLMKYPPVVRVGAAWNTWEVVIPFMAEKDANKFKQYLESLS